MKIIDWVLEKFSNTSLFYGAKYWKQYEKLLEKNVHDIVGLWFILIYLQNRNEDNEAQNSLKDSIRFALLDLQIFKLRCGDKKLATNILINKYKLNNKNIVKEYYKLHPLSHKYSLPEDELEQLSNIFSTHAIYSLCEIICNKKYKI